MLCPMNTEWIWLCVLAGGLAGTVVFKWAGLTPIMGSLKAVTSTAFLAIAITLGALDSRYGQCILLGLVLSWFGDIFLIWRTRAPFLAGLVAFLLAHVAYCGAFVFHGLNLGWSLGMLVVLVPVAAIIARWVLPKADPDMRAPVLAYMVVISAMVFLAAGAVGAQGPVIIIAGAVLFYISDVFVAREAFVAPGFSNTLLGLPMYYGGQVLLAWSIGFVG